MFFRTARVDKTRIDFLIYIRRNSQSNKQAVVMYVKTFNSRNHNTE
jgi:hypothetical protein